MTGGYTSSTSGLLNNRTVSQSVNTYTTLLPTEHMVHVYTHSVLNECVAESQSRGGGLTARIHVATRHSGAGGDHNRGAQTNGSTGNLAMMIYSAMVVSEPQPGYTRTAWSAPSTPYTTVSAFGPLLSCLRTWPPDLSDLADIGRKTATGGVIKSCYGGPLARSLVAPRHLRLHAATSTGFFVI